jgi:hypothetical protein
MGVSAYMNNGSHINGQSKVQQPLTSSEVSCRDSIMSVSYKQRGKCRRDLPSNYFPTTHPSFIAEHNNIMMAFDLNDSVPEGVYDMCRILAADWKDDDLWEPIIRNVLTEDEHAYLVDFMAA